MTFFYWFALNVTRLVRPLLWRVRFTGRENIPAQGGYVVACNHRSLADPILLAHGFNRQLFFLGKDELFNVPVLGTILNWAGVIGIQRGTGDMSAVDSAIQKLRDGGLLGIFPEGTRSPTQQPLRFKSGMAHMAKTAHVGVIPCAVIFSGKMKWMTKVEMRYGAPIPYEELFGEEQSAAALKRATKLVQQRINQLLGLEEAAR